MGVSGQRDTPAALLRPGRCKAENFLFEWQYLLAERKEFGWRAVWGLKREWFGSRSLKTLVTCAGLPGGGGQRRLVAAIIIHCSVFPR
jgi:hypothetical protein